MNYTIVDNLQLAELIDNIPPIIAQFKGGSDMDELAEFYKCDRTIIEAIVRLAFKIEFDKAR